MMVIILGSSLFDNAASNAPSLKIAQFIQKVMNLYGKPDISVITINLIIRKIAHFMEYLLLTLLLAIGFSNTLRNQGWAFFISAITAGFVSLIDEGFIQAASGRNSSLFDIMVDFAGVGGGLIVFALMLWLNVKPKR